MYLTNHPEAFGVALELPGDWQRLPTGAMEPFDRSLFEALAPGRDPWFLETEDPFWHRVFLIDEARGSQFDTLREHFARPSSDRPELPGPVAAVALTGSGFHGQRGRAWRAEAGNLHLCAAIAPRVPVSGWALALTTLPAVVAVDTIQEISQGRLEPRIKWVNDVLIDGKKVAGVLTATQSVGGLLDTAVFGIGLNVMRTPEVLPTPFVPEVGSIAGFGEGPGPSLALAVRAVLGALAHRVRTTLREGPDRLISDYLDAAAWMIGRKVRIYPEDWVDSLPGRGWPAPDAHGTLSAIRRDLALVIDGRTAAVHRGRLALEESCRSLGSFLS